MRFDKLKFPHIVQRLHKRQIFATNINNYRVKLKKTDIKTYMYNKRTAQLNYIIKRRTSK